LDSFFKTDFGIKSTIDDLLRQVNIYKQYANQVKFVFKGSVPDNIRAALEAAGAIVEVMP
jgi:hypothetical protein